MMTGSGDINPTVDCDSPPTVSPSASTHSCGAPPSDSQLPRRMGDFEILKWLGNGSMGVVYEARDLRHGTLVALKTIHPSWHGSITFFKQEFRALAELSHPNLITLGEMFSIGDELFFTMELIHGKQLLDHIRGGYDSAHASQSQGYDVDILKDAFMQLSRGIQALHDNGKLHRDIKPSNVMVRADGRIVLLDFGLTVELTDDVYANTLGDISGTPLYMSPEQFEGKAISLASDWYSLGVLLFEALTEKLPFPDASPAELYRLKSAVKRARPRDVTSDVPPELDRLCVDLLHPDPRRRPTGIEVLRRLGTTESPQLAKTPLVGRDLELEALRGALSEVHAGSPLIVAISGRSGLGKTELANTFLAEIRRQGRVVVLRGRCYEGESVPYKAMDSIVDGLARYLKHLDLPIAQGLLPMDLGALCRIFPVLLEVPAVKTTPFRPEIAVDVQDVRRRSFAALRELLARLGRAVRLVLFIDDLQWGDPDSAHLLDELIRLPEAPLCLLLCTYRTENRLAQCVTALCRPSVESYEPDVVPCRTIPLGPLKLEDAQRLAMALLAERSPTAQSQACDIARESAGDPLFVRVLATSVRDADHSPASAAGACSLAQVLWNQIDRLSVEQRAILEVLSVAACPLSRATIMQVINVAGDPLITFHQLRAQRMLRTSGGQPDHLEVYHDKIRETLVEHLTEERIVAIALRLAIAVENTCELVDPEWLAGLLSRAGEDRRAGRYWLNAAQQAEQTLAFSRAIELYRAALQALQPLGDEENKIRASLGDALAHAGHGSEAAEEYLRIAANAAPDEAADLRRRAALRYLTGGHIDAGIDALRQVLAAVSWKLPVKPWKSLLSLGWCRTRLWLFGVRYRPRLKPDPSGLQQRQLDACWCAAAGLSVIDPIRAADFVSRNLYLARRASNPRYYIRALAAQVGHCAIGGNRSRRSVNRLLRETRRMARSQGDPYSQACAEIARGVSAHLQGRWLQAKTCCDRAVQYLKHEQCRDVAWELDTAQTFAMWAMMYLGDISKLAIRQPLLLREAQERNDLFALLNFGTSVMAHVRLGAGESLRLRRELGEERRRLSQSGFFVQHHNWLVGRTFLELYEQDAQAAWGVVSDGWKSYRLSFLGRVQLVRIDFLQIQGRAAVAAAAQGVQTSATLAAARRIAGRLFRERTPWALAMAEAFSGSVAALQGDRATAIEHLRRAAAEFDTAQMHLFAASADIQLGRLLVNGDGIRLVDEGISKLKRLGVANPLKMADAIVPCINF